MLTKAGPRTSDVVKVALEAGFDQEVEGGKIVVDLGGGQEESGEDGERNNEEPEIEDLGSETDRENQVIKNHRQDLQIAADELEAFVENYEETSVDVNKSIEDLAVALATKEHPFSNFSMENTSNFFEEVVSFAKMNTPGLLYFVTRHINTPGKKYTHKTAIQVATIYGTFVRNLNPGVYDTMHKWLAIVLQSCGLTINPLFYILMLTNYSKILFVTNKCFITFIKIFVFEIYFIFWDLS